MKTGISTASLYGKMYTEQALEFFNKNGVENCEVFLSSFSEYDESFGKTLKEKQGKVNVHSIHTLNSQFEGQLFSHSLRQYEDAKKIFHQYPVKRTPAQWAFRWLWDQKEVTVVLSGMGREGTFVCIECSFAAADKVDQMMLRTDEDAPVRYIIGFTG